MKPVKIYTIHCNRADIIKWQLDSFKCHLSDQFELIVVNNARDPNHRQEINNAASELKLEIIETFYSEGPVGKQHADAFNYVWKNHSIKNNGTFTIMMDGDIFLIKKLNINDFMKDYAFAGAYYKRRPHYHYLGPAVVIMDTENIPDAETIDWEGPKLYDTGVEVALDTGGGTYLYFQSHPSMKEKVKNLKSSWHIKEQNGNRHCIPDSLLNEYNDEYHIEFFGNEFLHYRASSNWDWRSEDHHRLKSEFVKKFVYGTIDGIIIAKEHNFQMQNNEYFGWD